MGNVETLMKSYYYGMETENINNNNNMVDMLLYTAYNRGVDTILELGGGGG